MNQKEQRKRLEKRFQNRYGMSVKERKEFQENKKKMKEKYKRKELMDYIDKKLMDSPEFRKCMDNLSKS